MLFNSQEFVWFLLVVFVLYWFVFNHSLRLQNVLILMASYIFYGWWDYRFLSLIFLSTWVDYFVALRMEQCINQVHKKRWLWVSVAFNLGLLGFFKYYNFFAQSWVDAFAWAGHRMDLWAVQIVLPVGISFYTFQTMSYSLDVYHGKLKPTSNFVDFAAFVSFFPQLVAGPIERASNLLPQIQQKRTFSANVALAGFELILLGFFKKVVIADSLAGPVSEIFQTYQVQDGGTLILGVIFFAIQIYCDFSGYSDIAVGVAALFGFGLMRNFDHPYFSTGIAEFWRKWHISLSTWFRDYLYVPMGGSRVSLSKAIFNVWVVFLVSGLWHGANWTFLAWGFIHGLYFIPSFIRRKRFNDSQPQVAPRAILVTKLTSWIKMLFTFALVCLAWIFFRSDSIGHALDYISRLSFQYSFEYISEAKYVLIFLVFETSVYLMKRKEWRPFSYMPIRYMVYTYLFLTIVAHTTRMGSSFIYFQF